MLDVAKVIVKDEVGCVTIGTTATGRSRGLTRVVGGHCVGLAW